MAAVDVAMIEAVLTPIWACKTETASRLRGRIEAIMDFAKSSLKLRTGENPAVWKGNLKNALASPRKVHKVEHHPALPFESLAAFMFKLRDRPGIDARALEFLILTATRTNDVLGARRPEFNIDAGQWTIPDGRTGAEQQK